MKELQKYYAQTIQSDESRCGPEFCVYLRNDADAAFAEMRREREIDFKNLQTEAQLCIDKLKRQHAEEIERLKAQHELTIKRLQNAARTGMDAAHAISSHNLERARKLHSESKPEAIDSERRANAILTEENERLRKQAERYEELRCAGLRVISAIASAQDDLPAAMHSLKKLVLVDQLPASGEAQK